MEVARYPSTRGNHTDEFKAQAVALDESVGRTEAARQLEMPVKTLDNWVGAMRRGRPLSSPDRTSLLHSCSPSIPPDLPCTRLSNQRQLSDRVGGGFTSAVLSHHRTYGSVYGGSSYAAKPVYRIQYRDQSESIPQFLR
ncbi:TPA: transposase [Pseudomonas putida]|nr:transposase [Pseudomonas putida]HEN8717112.1 transposase [Pseudomonas putida]